MPITIDLKDNEFEITVLCPVGACLAQHTYAYNIELRDFPASDIKDVKSRMVEMTTKAHEDGKHVRHTKG